MSRCQIVCKKGQAATPIFPLSTPWLEGLPSATCYTGGNPCIASPPIRGHGRSLAPSFFNEGLEILRFDSSHEIGPHLSVPTKDAKDGRLRSAPCPFSPSLPGHLWLVLPLSAQIGLIKFYHPHEASRHIAEHRQPQRHHELQQRRPAHTVSLESRIGQMFEHKLGDKLPKPSQGKPKRRHVGSEGIQTLSTSASYALNKAQLPAMAPRTLRHNLGKLT